MNFSLEESEKSRRTIGEKEWMDRLNSVKIFKKDMDRLIMNFFLIEGYKEAAENFKKESGTESN